MGILTRNEILKELKCGNIKIKPFSNSQIGPASIDLHLGNEFRVFKEARGIYHVNDQANYKKVTRLIKVKNYLVVKPGEVIHGITKEKIEVMEHSPNRERTLNSFSQQPLKQDLVDDLLKELDL